MCCAAVSIATALLQGSHIYLELGLNLSHSFPVFMLVSYGLSSYIPLNSCGKLPECINKFVNVHTCVVPCDELASHLG